MVAPQRKSQRQGFRNTLRRKRRAAGALPLKIAAWISPNANSDVALRKRGMSSLVSIE
jgi:hypothetical protein